MTIGFAIASGFMLGLASSLHCVGYCGAIASFLAFATPRQAKSNAALARAILAPHLGRVVVYVVFGATVGAAVVAFGALVPLAGLRTGFQALASAALAWTGASIAGLLPLNLSLDRLFAGLSTFLSTQHVVRSSSIGFGMVWGCAPCAMVYSALLNASMTGSPIGGALFMLGFGIATVPSLATVGAGPAVIRRLQLREDTRHAVRIAVGFALVVMAIANAIFSWPGTSLLFCITK